MAEGDLKTNDHNQLESEKSRENGSRKENGLKEACYKAKSKNDMFQQLHFQK